jgi:hypothetical protein
MHNLRGGAKQCETVLGTGKGESDLGNSSDEEMGGDGETKTIS